jgi:transcriptional regulator with XRE-family HTH domain
MVRRQLGRRLRRLREAAGKTAADVAQAGVASKAKLSRIENGWTVVRIADVRALCWLYDADQPVTDTLTRLATGTVTPGWWEDRTSVPAGGERLYPGLEAEASRMCCYEPELVPTLLQTSDYLHAVTKVLPEPGHAERQAAELARRVRAGFERIEPLKVSVVLDAAVLSRVIGDQEVMSGQVRKLLQQFRLPHVDIRVLPWAAGAHAAMRGGFTLLEFDSPDDPAVVCVESLAGTRYVEELSQLALYRRVFAAIWRQSVSLPQYLAGGPASQAIDLRNSGARPDQLSARRLAHPSA